MEPLRGHVFGHRVTSFGLGCRCHFLLHLAVGAEGQALSDSPRSSMPRTSAYPRKGGGRAGQREKLGWDASQRRPRVTSRWGGWGLRSLNAFTELSSVASKRPGLSVPSLASRCVQTVPPGGVMALVQVASFSQGRSPAADSHGLCANSVPAAGA